MKYFLLTLLSIVFLIFLFSSPKNILASSHNYATQSGCSYNNTQARVQLNSSDPWKESMTVNSDQQFNVGGFHNGTGQFADDVTISLVGPGINRTVRNGETISNLQPGFFYFVNVTTNNQNGNSCTQSAHVYVRSIPHPQQYQQQQQNQQQVIYKYTEGCRGYIQNQMSYLNR